MLSEGPTSPASPPSPAALLPLISAAAPAAASAAATASVLQGQLTNAPIVTSLVNFLQKENTTAGVDGLVAEAVVSNFTAAPTLLTQYGPVTDLRSAAAEGECKTLWQLMQLSANLTMLVQTVKAAGLVDAFNTSTQQLTLFAPLDIAFQNPTAQMVSVSELLKYRPEVLSPVIGYNTLPGNYSLAGLQAGELLNTTASFANATDGVPLQLTVSYAGGNTAQVLGIQGVANVLQTDIPACGPSLLQLTDTVLLPFDSSEISTGVNDSRSSTFEPAAAAAG
ncbi:hypothetical protein ABBQ38_004668 [Trebouxia sp. C0009 RCD-2024]